MTYSFSHKFYIIFVLQCITDEKWGDWRPHLAMMLSNQTHKADLDRKCIMTMGDTLGMLISSLIVWLHTLFMLGSNEF